MVRWRLSRIGETLEEVLAVLDSVKVVKTIEVEVPELGKRIREARKADSRTITEIAAAVGMSVQNWYRIEDERQSLSSETLRAIERVLGVDFGVEFD